MSLVSAINETPFWTVSAFNWDPIECSSANFQPAFRLRGRPFIRWHDVQVPMINQVLHAPPLSIPVVSRRVVPFFHTPDSWWQLISKSIHPKRCDFIINR